ncbi:MAG: peptidyl-prolyl cis-trans isomerase [Polyangiaceae bacterium]|nr:peptidyl-prolyl cis-trans isomerase [Polyangiaceae bacterium]
MALDMPTAILIETNLGNIELALDDASAPKTVANFLRYVDAGHYAGTIFHRVISGFMAQGGGYDARYEKKPTQPPVENEADNGLKNTRGTVAMARTGDPHSATAQFFINLVDNAFLDHTAKTSSGWGYTVFGKVTSGMDVVDRMAQSRTGPAGPFSKDAPIDQIVIQSVRRL